MSAEHMLTRKAQALGNFSLAIMLCQNEEEAKFDRPVAMFKGGVWLKTARGGAAMRTARHS